ncbi:unnamed protein product [Brassicogethes aeneus]|uniref:Uncharacterized protein n=1 Tax=Brassicogethes aeneus TaxID=1431903 RepID=A0A9P0FPA4_BRAAE|nr:unnamed protein product [Brassicogethes aeneus]
MDKRKNKIHSLLGQIKDEAEGIKTSLNTIIEEIERKVNSDNKKSDILDIFEHEFEVLKKFTEINFSLESFIEDETSCGENEPLPLTPPKPISLCPNKSSSETLELNSSNLQQSLVVSLVNNLPSTSNGTNNEFSVADVDISVLKDNVKKLTEKLGLNDQTNQYTQYYEKNNSNIEQLLPERDLTPTCTLNNTLEENHIENSEVHPIDEEETSTEYESISSLNTENTAKCSGEKGPSTLLEKLSHLNNKNEPSNSGPDIPNQVKLMPTNTVIKNNLKKSKKGKKNANKTMYEITEKECPSVGSKCAFSHIESPDEFYLHMVDPETCNVLDEISFTIKEYARALPCYRTKDEASSAIGKYGVVLSGDGEWYRAEIIDWNLDNRSNQILAKLCEYGNNILVDYKNLRRLNKELAAIPKLAVRCHLPYLYSPDSTNANRLKNWPRSTIEAMIDMSGLFSSDEDEHKLFEIVYSNKVNESVEIDLYNPFHSEPDKTVGQILLDLGIAVQLIEQLDENNLDLEEYLEDVETYGTAANVNEAILGYDPRDQARICQFTRPDGTCFKGKNCKLEHILTKGIEL